MDKLREKYEKLTKKKAPLNISKVMLEKYITWYEQVNKAELKELQQLLKGKNFLTKESFNGTKLVREYQGKKYEVSIIDGGSHSSHPNGGFFYNGIKYKSLSKIAREITGTNWNGKLFFGCK
ncbi:MAG: DUF2924 domain-containing protein [Brevinema sp.]